MKERTKIIVTNYRKDKYFRGEIMLYINFAVNAGYAVFEAICGILLHSAWMGTLAFYYITLSSMRLYILRRHKQETERERLKAYRTCAVLLLLLTVAIAGIHILTMTRYYSVEYKGYMIYAVSTYTFYITISAIRNVIIYRKINDPILSASKAINLVAASISMYNLQAAMITAFGDGDEVFRITMGSCVGIGVLLIIISMSIYMIVKANKKLQH
ncbi:MAG: hypothetical protein NC089_11645 [Bacteroides sp.]|nr:hypothetical protein [Bacteroides sp.]MCM1549200.1 hypothetical protein [Clostridium sp.]